LWVGVVAPPPAPPHFRWLSLGQLHELFAHDDLVNMDARTVLSCLPFAGSGLGGSAAGAADGFVLALARSCDPGEGGAHTTEELLSWIADVRARREVSAALIPLDALKSWQRTDTGAIRHESGRFFSVIGVDVNIVGREVRRWYQPMIRPHGLGLAALLVKQIDGVLHVLIQARTEAGLLDVMELGPTLQCTPESYLHRPRAEHPPFLWDVLRADPGRIRYDTILSEEGGRFHHARTRHVIIDVGDDGPAEQGDYMWLTLHQLTALLRHSHYVNVQARSLIACLRSLWTSAAGPAPAARRSHVDGA
jgi:oxidase EvaA